MFCIMRVSDMCFVNMVDDFDDGPFFSFDSRQPYATKFKWEELPSVLAYLYKTYPCDTFMQIPRRPAQ